MKIVLGDEAGDHLRLAVTSYAHPGGLHVYDHNWLFSEVGMRTAARAFRCHAFLRTADFAGFAEGLQAVLSGEAGRAEFMPDDPWVTVCVVAEAAGFGVEVTARDGGSERVTGFRYAVDRSQLEELASDIHAVAARFPEVTGEPS